MPTKAESLLGGVAVATVLVCAACGGGSSSGKGERFGSGSNESAPIATQAPPTTTRLAASAVAGSYDIDITLASGANADKCRGSGTLHETVAVQDQPGDRQLTLTNDVPDANGQRQTESGTLHDDGSWDANGVYARADGNATYTWHGSFAGDGSATGTYAGATSFATCSWTFTAHKK